MASPSTRIVDHIVYLAPVGALEHVSQTFRDLGFTVIPGGTHADGLTANTLVILPDGVYLELIAFLRPATDYPPDHARSRHQWANKPPGFVAYAFLGAPDAVPSLPRGINARLASAGSAGRYKEGVRGGRTRGDGERLEWEICAPEGWAERVDGMGRPFYCGDLTPRGRRVPEDAAHRAHANRAVGIAHLKVLTARGTFDAHSKALGAILDGPPDEVVSETEHAWALD
ncbi:glyoxalase-like domain-containing protein, partial [Amylostereum chailletii]